jgi:rod shape determining protein RodA
VRTIASLGRSELALRDKVRHISVGLVLVVCALSGFGFVMLYSAAHGSADPWMSRQMARFAAALALMLTLALVDLRAILRVAYPLYLVAFVGLVYVEVAGEVGMGAQRWIDLKVFQLQPSEVMKVALVLALASYFHRLDYKEVGRPLLLVAPLLLVLAPVGLVMLQPDLGTAAMLLLVGAAMFFIAGVRWWKFLAVGAACGAVLPLAWGSLRDYQRQRILTFLDPSTDPRGTGYHITQSKIAFASGGTWGKGWQEGTQSQLGFLPERQTDFIFTMLAEEFGMAGGVALLCLYGILIAYGYVIAMRSRSQFGRLLALGLTANLFLYVFINMAMVMGLIPVVGVPLPLVSYGGTAQMTVMAGFGLLLSINVHRELRLGTPGRDDG